MDKRRLEYVSKLNAAKSVHGQFNEFMLASLEMLAFTATVDV